MVLKYTKEGKGDYERREIGGQVRVQNYQKRDTWGQQRAGVGVRRMCGRRRKGGNFSAWWKILGTSKVIQYRRWRVIGIL